MDHPYSGDKDRLLNVISDALGKVPIDFAEKVQSIQSTQGGENEYSAAGVLLLLHFRQDYSSPSQDKGEFTFQLIKRSSKVTQPGDLSCPGGILHRYFDPFLRFFITLNIPPLMTGKTRAYLRMRDKKTAHAITLFLTNAVREAWEETRLSPFNITLLGPLPSYTLHFFRRTIFPLVCYVKNEWSFRPSDEVDKLVEIPLNFFFNEANYGTFIIDVPEQYKSVRKGSSEFPCLILKDEGGGEEVLWGATFYIIMNFLQIVFDFSIPRPLTKRTIKRMLSPIYLTGHSERH